MLEKNCAICLEPITDPICIRCYIREVDIWLRDIGMNSISRNLIISKLNYRFFYETMCQSKCIVCNHEGVDVCFYCFSFISTKILMELNLPQEFIDNFSESFNYQIMNHG